MSDPSFRVTAQDGAWIFREGDPGDCAYVVEDGSVAISTRRDGEDVVIAERGPGEIFGEMAIVDDQPRSASARAVGATRLLVVSGMQLKARTDDLDPVMRMVVGVLLERLRASVSMVAERIASGEAEAPAAVARTAAEFDPAIAHIALEQELARAIDRDEIWMAFQPIVDARSTDLVGFEALMRWRSPTRGVVAPDRFVAAAEASGLVGPLTKRAITGAVEMLGVLKARGRRDLFVNVNAPCSEICRHAFADEIAASAAAAGVSHAQVGVELTETMLMESPECAILGLQRLRDAGLKTSVDDFGTGYSSLAYLSRYPIDHLKIDKSFVRAMHESRRDEKVVRTMIELGRVLGIGVVAEGVERASDAERLRAFGCDRFQGYLFGKPEPVEAALGRALKSGSDAPSAADQSAASAGQPADKQACSAASVASS